MSEHEQRIEQDIRDTYNSGNCKLALEKAIDYYRQYPDSVSAKYNFAVMHGDYSYSPENSLEESQRLLAVAKQGMKELFHHADFANWAEAFQMSIKNEYYWFFEMHKEQYELGVERISKGQIKGHYSACVGSSMLAYKKMLEKNIEESEFWARVSLKHFAEFEKNFPDWYNINHFSAQALACLGKYDEAMESFVDMYRKQGAETNQLEVEFLQKKLNAIKDIR